MIEYICNECKTFFEGKRLRKCPECQSKDTRRNEAYVKEEGFPTFIMKGDCHTNRVKARNYARNGMDKDTANEFYKVHTAASKERMKQSPYKRTVLTELGAKEAGIRQVPESEARKRKATAKKLGPQIQNNYIRKK